MAAARRGRTDVVDILLKNGARIEQRDELSRTALDYAFERGNQTDNGVVRLLTSRGAVQGKGNEILPNTQDDPGAPKQHRLR